MMEKKDSVEKRQRIPIPVKRQKTDELKMLFESVVADGNESAPSDAEIVHRFSQTFRHLFDVRKPRPRGPLEEQLMAAVEEALHKLPERMTKEDVEALVAFIYSIDEGRDQEEVADGVTLREARHFSQIPELIEKWQTKNCVGAAMLLTSVLKERGVEAYFANPVGHAVSLVRLQDGTLLYADPSTSVHESKGMCVDVTQGKVSMGSAGGVSVLRLRSRFCTPQHYSLVPFHRSLKVGYEHCIKENMDEFVVQKDRATALALRTMGDEVDSGLQCKISAEMVRLQRTDAWRKELERTSKADDVQIGLRAFRAIIGNEHTSEIKTRITSDKDAAAFYVQLLTSPPSKVAADFTAALQMKLPRSVSIPMFLEAHQAFWSATEGLRGIDPDAFVQSVEQSLR
ncbi:MAG: hypothetical protein Greene041619_794 [Candidatus Peregrinibacteria bacterium Greene0416_19]|nr:MAG: hypothetical protein Greene041619_794 [Candidatus Peregrinibacteria bacterium Greene0416_19]